MMNVKENGITLIALIITIIVLVILAAVSIKAVYDSRMVQIASNSAQDYARQANRENELLENTANILDSIIGGMYNQGGTDITQQLTASDVEYTPLDITVQEALDYLRTQYKE